MLILQEMEENCDFVWSCLFLNSQISDQWAPTGMNWLKLVFLITNFWLWTLISDSLIFSIENQIEITNFWLEYNVWSEIIDTQKSWKFDSFVWQHSSGYDRVSWSPSSANSAYHCTCCSSNKPTTCFSYSEDKQSIHWSRHMANWTSPCCPVQICLHPLATH